MRGHAIDAMPHVVQMTWIGTYRIDSKGIDIFLHYFLQSFVHMACASSYSGLFHKGCRYQGRQPIPEFETMKCTGYVCAP